eukprot:819818-Rhodomonas_salina.2
MSSIAYAVAMLCPVLPTQLLGHTRYYLRSCYAMFSTAYAVAMPCPVLLTSLLCGVRYWHRAWYISLRSCSGKSVLTASGTTGIGLHGCYAMSGTDLGYGAIPGMPKGDRIVN